MKTTLWLCIHLHRLVLDAVARGQPDLALAVSESRGSKRWIADASDTLLEQGIASGMGLAAAYALMPELKVFPRQPGAEQRALNQVAGWAYQISSQVSLQPPDQVLVEISASLRLLRQRGHWRQIVEEGLAQLGYQAQFSVAPTPAAARLMARAGCYRVLASSSPDGRQLANIPLAACDLGSAVRQALAGMGASCLGDLLQLPRDGLMRRFGQSLLDQLDYITGRLPEVLPRFEPPRHFCSRIELAADVDNTEGLLFAARRLLGELGLFLLQRDQAITEFQLGLEHAHGDTSWLRVGLLEPQRDPQRLLELLRERLQPLKLKAPVRQLVLNAPRPQAFAAQPDDLFEPAAPLQELARLLERLRSRLGDESVYSLAEYADHRPEVANRSWQVNEPAVAATITLGPRPTWLVNPPRPLPLPPAQLLAGPERIESGWWDGADVRRDYYVARQPTGQLLWVFQECGTQQWFMHGMFS